MFTHPQLLNAFSIFQERHFKGNVLKESCFMFGDNAQHNV